MEVYLSGTPKKTNKKQTKKESYHTGGTWTISKLEFTSWNMKKDMSNIV